MTDSEKIDPLWRGIPGWTTPCMFACYEEIVREAKDGDTIVEVGTFLGRSLCYLCYQIKLHGKPVKVLSVDLFPDKIPYQDGVIRCDCLADGSLSIVRANVMQGGFQGMVKFIRGDSANAAMRVEDESVFAVYLDGNHTRGGVSRDIHAWLPKVKRGGILAGHDYGSPGHEGVKQAVDEILGGKVRVNGSTWMHRP